MIAALVPVKRLSEAKRRLSHVLSAEERCRLSLAMLADVVRALQAVPDFDRTAVVSGDKVALDQARELGAEPLPEPPGCHNVNDALAHASSALAADGAQALLIVAADIPTAEPSDIKALLEALPGPGLAVAPTDDLGTGALALRPPDAVPFRYGPDSALFHRREALARGLTVRLLRLESLARDVDQPQDLAWLLSKLDGGATLGVLRDMRIADRLAAGRIA